MLYSNFALSGSVLLLFFLGIVFMLISIILVFRWTIDKKAVKQQAEKSDRKFVLRNRTKNPGADIFRLRSTFFKIGLAVSLFMVLLAFNWAVDYDENSIILENALEMSAEIEITTPRTKSLSTLPPPPIVKKLHLEEFVVEDLPSLNIVDKAEKREISDVDRPSGIYSAPPLPEVQKQEIGIIEIFKVVEEMPRFPGCDNEPGDAKAKEQCAQKKMLEFIYKNIKYPAIARENGVEGTVVVTFVVEKDGSISDAKTLRDIGAQCGEEALRIVKMMPKWTPGKQRGNSVRVQFNLPVRFKLE